jgi:choline oxidase
VTTLSDIRRADAALEAGYGYSHPIVAEPGGNQLLEYRTGKVLGGSSSVNAAIALPPPDYDLRSWEASGAHGWGPLEMGEAQRRVRRRVTIAPVARPNRHPAAEAFVAAAQQAGHCLVAPGDLGFSEGVAWTPLSVDGSTRQSSSAAYLHRSGESSSRLTVLLNTEVKRVRFSRGGRANGVEVENETIGARIGVILSCGALGTPKLLMLSGIGPAEHLRAHSIDVRVDLPGVGRHLVDHPEIVILWRTQRRLPPSYAHGWEVTLVARSAREITAPDVVLHFGTLPRDLYTARHGYPTASEAITMMAYPCHPKSEGAVTLTAPDVSAPLRVMPRFFAGEGCQDVVVLQEAIGMSRMIADQPALKPWIGEELAPGAEVSGRHLSQFVRQTSGTMFHPTGTCRMGAEEPHSVVTPTLQVRGVDGLRVADASIFPTMVSSHPCFTCLMVGERCADLVLSEDSG